MKKEEIYLCEPWNYHEEKNGKHLLIWSDLPRWLVVDKDLFILLNSLNGKENLNSVINHLSKKLDEDRGKIKEKIKEVLPTLIKSCIIYERGYKRTSPEKELKITDVTIHITNKCNLNCKMCANKFNVVSSKEEIELEKIKEFLNQVLEFTDEDVTISISGGEPLLVKDKTLAVAKYAKKDLGIKYVFILTNGTLITREFAKKAKDLDLTLQVSVDSAYEKEHDFLRGKGMFKKTIKNIKILKEEGVYVITSMVAHKRNYKSLGTYFDLALELGVDGARYIPLKKIGGGLGKILDHAPVDDLIKTTYKLYKENPNYFKIKQGDYFTAFADTCRLCIKHRYCGTGLISVALNSDGSIFPCSGITSPEMKAGSILESSFREIWLNSPVLKKIRRECNIDNLNEKCSKCIVRHWCLGGCRGEAYHVTGKLNSPDPQCEKVKKAIIDMIWILSESPELGKDKIYQAH